MSQKITVTVKEGVPYGQSTAGQARFKDPVKVKPWSNLLDTTIEREGCFQFSFRKKSIAGNEDCLYSNIHTIKIPSKDDNQLKPVIVNIHPGGLFHGSPDPDYYGSAEYVMNRDIVYVCVAYRLHVLGHLNLNVKNQCTGNQSLKDIILSLKWMKENIHVFGGDPDNITLLGSSSGAALVHYLLLSPLAKGLYHKAILMGMYAFNPTLSIRKEHITLAYDAACRRSYDGNIEDRRKLLNFYKQIDLDGLLLSELYKSSECKIDVFPCSSFTPTEVPGENSLFPTSFKELIPSTNHIPIMVGFCNREGIMGVALLNKTKSSLAKYFCKSLTQNEYGWGASLKDDDLKLIRKKVEDFYLNGESMDTASETTKCDILTDLSLSDVYDSLINVVSSNSTSPVYVYNFTYDGGLTSIRNEIDRYFHKRVDGAVHAADYGYWCHTEKRRNRSVSQIVPEDREMIDTMTNLLTTFAKTGNPNNDQLPVNWKPSTPESPCYLNIDNMLEVKDELLRGERMEFWHNLKKQFETHCEN